MTRAVFTGVAASPGVGIGRALRLAGVLSEGSVAGSEVGFAASGDTSLEGARLQDAIEATAAELTALAARTASSAGMDVAAILEAQAVIARDPAIVAPALESVCSGAAADEALLAAANRQSEKLAALDDPYFQARAADVLDVARRIARRITGRQVTDPRHADGTPAVLIADDLGPSETASLRPELVAGIALAGGTVVGHAAIIARALELPLVLDLGAGVLHVAPDAVVLVHGSSGRVVVDPDDDEIRARR